MKIKRKTLDRLKKQLLILVVCGGLFLAWYTYYRTKIFEITSYRLVGVEEADIPFLNESLVKSNQGYTYKIFPNNKIFTYDTESMIGTIQNVIPEVKTIEIRPSGLHTIKVVVTQHALLFKSDNTIAISEDGILFTTKKDLSKYPLFFVASSTKKTIKLNDLSFFQIEGVDRDLLGRISKLEKKVSSVIFPVGTITIDSVGDVSLIDGRGVSKVMFTKESDIDKVWSTLVSAIDTEPLKSKLASSLESLEYLDVRFGNKVFYKFNTSPFKTIKPTGILENHDTGTTTENISQ